MSKFPMSLTSSVTAASTDRNLEHHPLDRRAVAVGVPVPTDSTVALRQAPGLDVPTLDLRVMATMLNDAMCQVTLLRNEVSDLRRKLERADDWAPSPVGDRTGTIHVSVRTGTQAARGASDSHSSPSEVPTGRESSFDWDAWQRETKARIRRAMAYQSVSSGALGAGAE